VPSPVPDAGDADNQAGKPVTDHDVFDDTCTDTEPPDDDTPVHTAGDTDRVGTTRTGPLVADTSAQPYFDAVACTVTGNPTSAVTNVYVFPVAPWIGVPSRDHWNDHEPAATDATGFAVNT